MSGYARIPNWILRDPTISCVAVRLLGALLTHSRPDGTGARPGIDLLASYLGCSTRTVKRGLTELRDRGLVTWDRTPTSSQYTILLSPPGSDTYVTTPEPGCDTTVTSVVTPVSSEMGHPCHRNKNQEQAPGTKEPVAAAPEGPEVDLFGSPVEKRRGADDIVASHEAGWASTHNEPPDPFLAKKVRGLALSIAKTRTDADSWDRAIEAAYRAGRSGLFDIGGALAGPRTAAVSNALALDETPWHLR